MPDGERRVCGFLQISLSVIPRREMKIVRTIDQTQSSLRPLKRVHENGLLSALREVIGSEGTG